MVCELVSEDRAVAKLHLQAQLHYRLGETSEAIQLYKQLLQQHKVGRRRLGFLTAALSILTLCLFCCKGNDARCSTATCMQVHSLELSTNVVAAHVAAGRSEHVSEVMSAMRIGPHEGFEVAFNLGCAQLASSDFEAAHDQLLHAQRLGGPLHS